jgi:arsenate reductase
MARILFVCTGNIARSQMAEGLARSLAAPGVDVASAGTHPDVRGVHRFAVQAMQERGLDISAHRSKRIEEVPGEFDYVITLCDEAVQECPVLPARRARMHWSLPDPAAETGDEVRQLDFFRQIRDDIERRLREWMGREGLLVRSKS